METNGHMFGSWWPVFFGEAGRRKVLSRSGKHSRLPQVSYRFCERKAGMFPTSKTFLQKIQDRKSHHQILSIDISPIIHRYLSSPEGFPIVFSSSSHRFPEKTASLAPRSLAFRQAILAAKGAGGDAEAAKKARKSWAHLPSKGYDIL